MVSVRVRFRFRYYCHPVDCCPVGMSPRWLETRQSLRLYYTYMTPAETLTNPQKWKQNKNYLVLTLDHDQDLRRKCRCRHRGSKLWRRTERSAKICWRTWRRWKHRRTSESRELSRKLDSCCTHSSECWSDQITTSQAQCIAVCRTHQTQTSK